MDSFQRNFDSDFLISLCLSHDLVDGIGIKAAFSAQLAHSDGLGVGRKGSFGVDIVHKVAHFLLLQVGQFHGGAHTDLALIHKLQKFGREFVEADVAADLIGTFTTLLRNDFPRFLAFQLVCQWHTS